VSLAQRAGKINAHCKTIVAKKEVGPKKGKEFNAN
jgi:hypothetical protein